MISLLVVVVSVLSATINAELTLPGPCPPIRILNQKGKLEKTLDFTRFSGVWYNAGSYASDGRTIYDCATLDFEEDSHGYILKETYIVDSEGNRTQQMYTARVDPMFGFGIGNKAQFVVSHEDNDKILQFPFFILSTDYDNYTIAYTCKSPKQTPRLHYAYTWLLTRDKKKIEGELLMKVTSVLAFYPEVFEHRKSFVYKDFDDKSCSYSDKYGSEIFTSNFS